MSTPALYNETELLSRIAAGDEKAFTALFRHYNKKVYGIVVRLTRHNQLAEEIVQDVFLIIWQKRREIVLIQDFRAYLFTIARNKIYKALKRKAIDCKTDMIHRGASSSMHNDTENRIIEKDNNLLLQKIIDQLPAQQKKVYRLMKEQGMKRGEVAELLQIHPETIKSHLAQAMKSIRNFCMVHLKISLMMACLFGKIAE